jgi:hypothetical protein
VAVSKKKLGTGFPGQPPAYETLIRKLPNLLGAATGAVPPGWAITSAIGESKAASLGSPPDINVTEATAGDEMAPMAGASSSGRQMIPSTDTGDVADVISWDQINAKYLKMNKGPGANAFLVGQMEPQLGAEDQALKQFAEQQVQAAEAMQGYAFLKANYATQRELEAWAELAASNAVAVGEMVNKRFPEFHKRLKEFDDELDQIRTMQVNPYQYLQQAGVGGRAASVLATAVGQIAAGSGSISSARAALNNAISRDISAQQYNIELAYKGVAAARDNIVDQLDMLKEEVLFRDKALTTAWAAVEVIIQAARQGAQNEAAYIGLGVLQHYITLEKLAAKQAQMAKMATIVYKMPLFSHIDALRGTKKIAQFNSALQQAFGAGVQATQAAQAPVAPTAQGTPQPGVSQRRLGGQSKADTYRADGTQKGPGWQGTIKTPDGRDMTENSIGVQINGKETEIPSIVPSTTPEEVQAMLQGKMLPSAVEKAVSHAKERISKGLSPFKEGVYAPATAAATTDMGPMYTDTEAPEAIAKRPSAKEKEIQEKLKYTPGEGERYYSRVLEEDPILGRRADKEKAGSSGRYYAMAGGSEAALQLPKYPEMAAQLLSNDPKVVTNFFADDNYTRPTALGDAKALADQLFEKKYHLSVGRAREEIKYIKDHPEILMSDTTTFGLKGETTINNYIDIPGMGSVRVSMSGQTPAKLKEMEKDAVALGELSQDLVDASNLAKDVGLATNPWFAVDASGDWSPLANLLENPEMISAVQNLDTKVNDLAIKWIKQRDPSGRLSDQDITLARAMIANIKSSKIMKVADFADQFFGGDANAARDGMQMFWLAMAVEAQNDFLNKHKGDVVLSIPAWREQKAREEELRRWINRRYDTQKEAKERGENYTFGGK